MSDAADTGSSTIIDPTDAAAPGAASSSQGTPAAADGSPPAGGQPQGVPPTIGDGKVDDKPTASPSTWPDDWRARLAGDDKSYLKTLERFPDPGALAKSYRELQAKVSSGQTKLALKPDASPEELATWRKEQGIPEAPDGYKVELGDGQVIGEAEKPLVDLFLKDAHASNMPPEQVNMALRAYYKIKDQQEASQYEADVGAHQRTQDELRNEWGNAFRSEVNGLNNWFSATFGQELAASMMQARMPDGSLFGNHPAVVKTFAQIVREANPMAALVPAGTSNPVKAGTDRIAEIEKIMTSDQQTYWRTPSLQDEYRNLLEAREAIQRKAG